MKKSGLVVLALVFVIAAAFLTGCGKEAKKETKDSGKLKVVATIFPEYDFLRQIGGDKIDLSMLVPPGSETHSFEVTVSVRHGYVFYDRMPTRPLSRR